MDACFIIVHVSCFRIGDVRMQCTQHLCLSCWGSCGLEERWTRSIDLLGQGRTCSRWWAILCTYCVCIHIYNHIIITLNYVYIQLHTHSYTVHVHISTSTYTCTDTYTDTFYICVFCKHIQETNSTKFGQLGNTSNYLRKNAILQLDYWQSWRVVEKERKDSSKMIEHFM
jgi:hypothetical protein